MATTADYRQPTAVHRLEGTNLATPTALASEVTDRLRTVTLGFEEFRGPHNDEVPGAERLAERYDTDLRTV